MIKRLSILVLLIAALTLCVEGKQFKGKKLAVYNVSGTLEPDAAGDYYYGGEYVGEPYYRREDGAWFIWWHPGPGRWYISSTVGYTGSYWRSPTTSILGTYMPSAAYHGTATVAAGPQ